MSKTKTKLNSIQNQREVAEYSTFSVVKMFTLFLRLTGEQTSLLFKREIEGKGTIHKWHRLFEQITKFDKHADNSQKLFIRHVWIRNSTQLFCDGIIIGLENITLLNMLWRIVFLFLLLHLLLYGVMSIEPNEGFYFIFAFVFLFIVFSISSVLKTYPIVNTKIYTYPWLSFSLKIANKPRLPLK